jgi:hypothetical protein
MFIIHISKRDVGMMVMVQEWKMSKQRKWVSPGGFTMV